MAPRRVHGRIACAQAYAPHGALRMRGRWVASLQCLSCEQVRPCTVLSHVLLSLLHVSHCLSVQGASYVRAIMDPQLPCRIVNMPSS